MRIAIVIASLFIVACSSSPSSSEEPGATQDPGPRSGLAEDTLIRDLSNADRSNLCSWWAETLGGVGRMQSCAECSDNACTDWDVSVSTNADCVAWLATVQCEVTVHTAEDCAFAQQPDLCAFPSACDPFDGC